MGYLHHTQPNFKNLTFKIINDPQTRLLAIQKGSIDILINALNPSQIQEAQKSPKLTVQESDGITYHYLNLNTKFKHLKNKNVRQALAYGINRDEIIKFKLKGLANPANSLLSTQNYYYEKNVKIFSYEPNKAKALLKKAGYDEDNPLTLEFKTSTDPHAVSIALILKEQLAKIGVTINIKSFEWATFYDDIKKGNFQMHSLRRVGLTEPSAYYDYFHSSQFPPHGQNRGWYVNLRIDKLTKTAGETLDIKKRKQLYSEIQQIISKDVPYINLWHSSNISVYVKDRIMNLIVPPNGHLECILKVIKT